MPTVFVDESGTFNSCKGQEFFVIASFTVGDPRRTAKAFRRWQQQEFPKVKRFQPEVKFSETGLSDALRLSTLQYISSLDVRVHYGFLRCNQIPTSLPKSQLREGLLYTQILGEVLETYFPVTDQVFMARCDQRNLKGITKSEFVQTLKTRLLPIAPAHCLIDIVQVDSTQDSNIQIADWIAGALAAHLNGKKLGSQYYEILKSNIIGVPIELFKY